MLAEANPSKVWAFRLSLWVALGGVVVTAAVVFGIWAVNTAPGNAVAPSEKVSPDADGAFEGLRRQGVLVKNLNMPAMQNCLRITIGTPDENRILLNALRESL